MSLRHRRLDAARLLADRGAVAEALWLAVDGLRDAEPSSALRDRLAARGVVDGEEPGDRALLTEVLEALEGRSESDRRELLVQGTAILALLGYLALELLHPFGVRVVASAEFDLGHRAENALDGREATEWLLPDHTAGWIELRFRRRTVTGLRVLNGSNRPGPDRAVVDYDLEVFDGDVVVQTVRGTLGAFERRPHWQRIAFAGVRATRVRLHVRSWAGSGGGLAELRLE